MKRIEQERLVLELACLTEHRDGDEQRAMLAMAMRLDDEHNKAIVTNPLYQQERRLGPLWYLYDLVASTRVLEDDQRATDLPAKQVAAYRKRQAEREAIPERAS